MHQAVFGDVSRVMNTQCDVLPPYVCLHMHSIRLHCQEYKHVRCLHVTEGSDLHMAHNSLGTLLILLVCVLLYHRCSGFIPRELCPPDPLPSEYIMISNAAGNEEAWGESDKRRGTFQQLELTGSGVTCHLSMSGFSLPCLSEC